MYIYSNHLNGNLYASEEKLSFEELYCDNCGDYDEFIGFVNNRNEAKQLLWNNNESNGGYSNKYILEFLDSVFPNKTNSYKLKDLTIGMEIENLNQLNKIYETYIILKKQPKKSKKYNILYIGDKFNDITDNIIKNNLNLYIHYKSKNIKFNFDNVNTNSHQVNTKIKANILNYDEMKKIGFNGKYYEGTKNEQECSYFYFSRGIMFPPKYKNIDISFNINIPKDGSDINIYVLDEEFGQPYDYQRMLIGKPNEVALIVFNQVEMWMDYLQRHKVLEGHIRGEYI